MATECGVCGTWICAECGWKRHGASLTYPSHNCALCQSRRGTIKPNYHRPGTVIASTHATDA